LILLHTLIRRFYRSAVVRGRSTNWTSWNNTNNQNQFIQIQLNTKRQTDVTQ